MARVFADTNIVLDWLGDRAPYAETAAALSLLGEQRRVEIFVSPFTYMTTEYILRKQIGKAATQQALAALRAISKVAGAETTVIDKSLLSSFRDYEDALQYECAARTEATVIITRNPKDFKHADIPVMQPAAYLAMLKR